MDVQVAAEEPAFLPGARGAYGFSVAPFMNWQAYDLINVSTHGRQFCREEEQGSRCSTLILTGQFAYITRARLDAGGFDLPPGAYWARITGADVDQVSLVLSTDFFRAHYPGGLDDKVIFFNACETAQANELVDAISGENTAVLGWSAAVDSPAAQEIAEKLYELLLEEGLRVGRDRSRLRRCSLNPGPSTCTAVNENGGIR